METTNMNVRPSSNLSVILLGLTLFLLVLNLSTYGCSWYGRKPMTPEELSTGNKEEYFERKKPWNVAVFYLLGISTTVTFIQMIIIMWQAWGLRRTEKAEALKKSALEEAKIFI